MTYAIQEFPVLPSTNAYVKENASSLRHGDVIVARRQTVGRGRLDRTWASDEGGLYFTIMLRPTRTAFLANMTQLLSLAVCGAVEAAGVPAGVKWPNDVMVNGAKIAGILSEAIVEGDAVAALALGAGINVSQKTLDVPGRKTTSLRMEGVDIPGTRLLESVLGRFFAAYELVLEKGFSVIREEYVQKLTSLGEEVCVDTGSETVSGTFLRVTYTGRLVLGLENETVREICMGDMR